MSAYSSEIRTGSLKRLASAVSEADGMDGTDFQDVQAKASWGSVGVEDSVGVLIARWLFSNSVHKISIIHFSFVNIHVMSLDALSYHDASH